MAVLRLTIRWRLAHPVLPSHTLQSARVDCGFADIDDVRTHAKRDRMQSFFLAETVKYLWLLFDEASEAPVAPQFVQHAVFSTEGHIFPLLPAGAPPTPAAHTHKSHKSHKRRHAPPPAWVSQLTCEAPRQLPWCAPPPLAQHWPGVASRQASIPRHFAYQSQFTCSGDAEADAEPVDDESCTLREDFAHSTLATLPEALLPQRIDASQASGAAPAGAPPGAAVIGQLAAGVGAGLSDFVATLSSQFHKLMKLGDAFTDSGLAQTPPTHAPNQPLQLGKQQQQEQPSVAAQPEQLQSVLETVHKLLAAQQLLQAQQQESKAPEANTA